MRAIWSLGILLALGGCASTKIDRAAFGPPLNRVELEPLKLEISSEPRLLRIDLVRAQHTEARNRTVSNGTSSSVLSDTVEVPNPYHELALDFGNGILMDYNHNLFVDLVRFYRLDHRKPDGSFRAAVDLNGAKRIATNRNGQFTSADTAFFGGVRTVTTSKNAVKIQQPGFLGAKATILTEGTTISYQPEGFLGLGAVTLVQTDPDAVTIPSFFGKSEFRKTDDDRVVFDTSFSLIRERDVLTVQFTGLFGVKAEYLFFRTDHGFVFYNAAGLQGIDVSMEGNRILVTNQNGKIGEVTLDP